MDAPQWSASEVQLYSQLFRQLDEEAANCVSGAAAVGLLTRSGLPKKVLHDIWAISDQEDEGKLMREQFFVACRLVSHAQNGHRALGREHVLAEPPALPDFGAAGAFASVGSSTDTTFDVTEAEKTKYTAGFIRAERDGFVDGAAAKELLQKSALPHTDLCAIWDLADMDRDGQLNLPEFVAAQHLVAKRLAGLPIPPVIPSSLQEVLRALPLTPYSMRVARDDFASAERGRSPTPPRMVVAVGGEISDEQQRELLRERSEVERQLDRRQEFEKQCDEARADWRAVEAERGEAQMQCSTAQVECARIQDQIAATRLQVQEVQAELESIRESHRELGGRTAPLGVDILSHARAEKQSLDDSEREISELRAKDNKLTREKLDLQAQCAVLLEKVRQADQDRTMVGNAVETERAKLNALLKERACLLEERLQRTHQMTALSTSAWMGRDAAPLPVPSPPRVVAGAREKGIPTTEVAPQAAPNSSWIRFGSDPQLRPLPVLQERSERFATAPPRGAHEDARGGSGVLGGSALGRARDDGAGVGFDEPKRGDAFDRGSFGKRDEFGASPEPKSPRDSASAMHDGFAKKKKDRISGSEGFSGDDLGIGEKGFSDKCFGFSKSGDGFGDKGFDDKAFGDKGFGDRGFGDDGKLATPSFGPRW